MKTNDIWLLDAHCDSLEMRNFLCHNFDLTKGTYSYAPATKKFLKNTFKFDVPPRAKHQYHVLLSRLQQGKVRVLFLNIGDYELLPSALKLDAAYSLTQNYNDQIALCCNSRDVRQTVASHKLAIVLSAESPCSFQNQMSLLRHWYRLGLRIINLSHGEGTLGLPTYPKLIYKKNSERIG